MSLCFQCPGGAVEERWIIYALMRDNIQHHLEQGSPSGAFEGIHRVEAVLGGRVVQLNAQRSRGALEGKCKGEEFGMDRVKNALQGCKSTQAKEVCSKILDGIQQFMCVPPTHDDVTALALIREATKAEAAGA